MERKGSAHGRCPSKSWRGRKPKQAPSPDCVSSLSINYDHLTVVASQEAMHRKRSSCWFYRFQLVLDSRGTSQARNHRVRPSGTAPDSGVNAPQGCHTHTLVKGLQLFLLCLPRTFFANFATCCAAPSLANEVVPPSISYIAIYLYMFVYSYNHRLKTHSSRTICALKQPHSAMGKCEI